MSVTPQKMNVISDALVDNPFKEFANLTVPQRTIGVITDSDKGTRRVHLPLMRRIGSVFSAYLALNLRRLD